MTIRNNSPLTNIFPEFKWKELDPNAYREVYIRLENKGQYCSRTLEYLQEHRVKLGFLPQAYSGGGWTFLRNITLAPDETLDDPYTTTLIIHEVFHLGQSIFSRLSVYGELLAWQYQKQAYYEVSGKEIGEIGEAYSGKKDLWHQISVLSPEVRDDLAKAQELMKRIAEGYRSDCLPLYPLPKEIWYFLKQGNLISAFAAIYNLVTCR